MVIHTAQGLLKNKFFMVASNNMINLSWMTQKFHSCWHQVAQHPTGCINLALASKFSCIKRDGDPHSMRIVKIIFFMSASNNMINVSWMTKKMHSCWWRKVAQHPTGRINFKKPDGDPQSTRIVKNKFFISASNNMINLSWIAQKFHSCWHHSLCSS